MISGLGVTEILVVLTMVLLFFGSKELPQFIREGARFLAKMRGYADKVRRELDDVGRSIDISRAGNDGAREKKEQIRTRGLQARRSLSHQEREEKSRRICEYLTGMKEFNSARAVMVYVAIGAEVDTRYCIDTMRATGKRIIVPYCRTASAKLCIAEITDPDTDLGPGAHGAREPHDHLRDNFFRSDLQMIVCPGVAFDRFGGRLGRGKSYYDRFLEELKGSIPIVGIAFDCQVTSEPLPFEYHDIAMDQVITESGLLIQRTARD